MLPGRYAIFDIPRDVDIAMNAGIADGDVPHFAGVPGQQRTGSGVAPEFASSFTFPQLIGRQNASWVLLSSEWLSAEECRDMGLVFKVTEPDELMDVTMTHARVLASKPISSLVESKATIVESTRDPVTAAYRREAEAFKLLLGAPANVESMMAFAEKRHPDFTTIDDSAVNEI